MEGCVSGGDHREECPSWQRAEDPQRELEYEQRLENLQLKVSDLLSTIDDVHEENVELAHELSQIYEEMANEKEMLEENMN